MIPPEEVAAHHELQAWTLTLGDPTFVHQHVVDAWAAQHPAPDGPSIGLAFALAGLCLRLEFGFSGRQVQLAHMALARRGGKQWPRFPVPEQRGAVRVTGVVGVPPEARVDAIDRWCRSVWSAHRESHQAVRALLARYGYQPGADPPG